MSDKYTIKDVTTDLAFLVSLTRIFTVDDEGFWIDVADKEHYVHKLDANDQGKEIVVFQDPMPEGQFHYFNPYSEGLGKKSPISNFYYKSVRVAFNSYLTESIRYVIAQIHEHKNQIATNPEHLLPNAIIRATSVPVDKNKTLYDVVDDKLIEEIDTIVDRIGVELLFVGYRPDQMKSFIKIEALSDPKWDEKFGKDIRKKSLQAFKSLVLGVLDMKTVSDIDTFTSKYDPDTKSSARLYTTLSIYAKLYSRINDILSEVGKAIDIDELIHVIDRSTFAYAIAKHMVQPVTPAQSPTDTSSSQAPRINLSGGSGISLPQNKFGSPEIIDNFGRKVRQGQAFGDNSTPAFSKFQPHVYKDSADPFSPSVQPAVGISNSFGGSSFGGGFGNAGSMFSSGFGGSSFGGSNMFNTTPPSNFGSPNTISRLF